MTTTDPPGFPPPSASSAPSGARSGRLLRRSRTGRVGAGVASGLGEYFGFDPVLFRVLFATSAFFGGAGVIAYLLAWAAIPEEGTVRAPIDGWVGQLRQRRVPIWLVAIVAGLLLWLAAFSWWAPGPFLPILGVVIILVVAFGRREWQAGTAPTVPPENSAVNLSKDATAEGTPGSPDAPPTDRSQNPSWVNDIRAGVDAARAWADEARVASRARRRRTLPVRIGLLVAFVVAVTVLGTIDAITGIPLPVYFWTLLGIVVTGLLVGMIARRTPWSVAVLLVPATIGLVAFGGSHASLHDGIGQRQWQPTVTTASSHYRLALGDGELDLRQLPTLTTPQTINVTVGAGRVRIIAPKSMNLTVLANIHLGQLDVDSHTTDGNGHGGIALSRIVNPPAGAAGAPITVDVHLADGQVEVLHR